MVESSVSTTAAAATACSRESSESFHNNNDDDNTNRKAACRPCSTLDPSFLLDTSVLRDRLAHELPLWSLVWNEYDNKNCDNTNKNTTTAIPQLERTFVAKNFVQALRALHALGAVAEAQQHHPDLHLTDYRTVRLVVWTHKLRGVTENDLTLASLLDATLASDPDYYSPKWLREHPEAVMAHLSSSSLSLSNAKESLPSQPDTRTTS